MEDIGQKKIRHANQVFPVGELEEGFPVTFSPFGRHANKIS